MEVFCSEDKLGQDQREESDGKRKHQNKKNKSGLHRRKAEIKGFMWAEKKVGGVWQVGEVQESDRGGSSMEHLSMAQWFYLENRLVGVGREG